MAVGKKIWNFIVNGVSGVIGIGAAALFGNYDILRALINSDKHFHKYKHEEKELIIEQFMKEGYGVNIHSTVTERISDKLDNTLELLDNYSKNLEKTYPKVNNSVIELSSEKNTSFNEDFLQKNKTRITVLKALISNVNNPSSKYNLSDTFPRAFRVLHHISADLDKQFAAEQKVCPTNELSGLKAAQDKIKAEILHPLNEAIKDLHLDIESEYNQSFAAALYFKQLELLRNKLAALDKNKNDISDQVAISSHNTTLTMRNFNIESLGKDFDDVNKNFIDPDDHYGLTATNGQKIKISYDHNTKSTKMAFELPRSIWQPGYYLSPYSNVKSTTMDAISLWVGSSHLRGGGRLELTIEHSDPTYALDSSREQYLAAIESGLKPDKEFYIVCNGRKYTNDEFIKEAFVNRDDQAALDKSRGIAQRAESKARQKWDEISKKAEAAAKDDKKAPTPEWKVISEKTKDAKNLIKNNLLDNTSKPATDNSTHQSLKN